MITNICFLIIICMSVKIVLGGFIVFLNVLKKVADLANLLFFLLSPLQFKLHENLCILSHFTVADFNCIQGPLMQECYWMYRRPINGRQLLFRKRHWKYRQVKISIKSKYSWRPLQNLLIRKFILLKTSERFRGLKNKVIIAAVILSRISNKTRRGMMWVKIE